MICTGGAAGQLNYPENGGAPNFAVTIGGGDNDEDEFLNSRAEAKRAHAERMSQLRQTDERHSEAQEREVNRDDSQPKQTAFQIAVSVANAADQKVGIFIFIPTVA